MEDNFIMMVSKGKGLYPNLNNKNIAQSINDDIYMFESIKGRLIIPENKDGFLDGVKDIYHTIMGDFYEMHGETKTPSVSEVSDFIDEYNSNLISLLIGEGGVHLDNILTIYTGAVTSNLENDVEDALRIMGLPYINNDNGIGVINRHSPIPYHDPYQISMFGDELYE